MGLTCKPIGKNKSIMRKLQNKMEKEQKLNTLQKNAEKQDKKSQLEKN